MSIKSIMETDNEINVQTISPILRVSLLREIIIFSPAVYKEDIPGEITDTPSISCLVCGLCGVCSGKHILAADRNLF